MGTQIIDARIDVLAQVADVGVQVINAGIYVAQARVIDQDSNQHRQHGGKRG
jgi:hypothetical protein